MPWFQVYFEKKIPIRVEADSLEAAEKAADDEAYGPNPAGFYNDTWDVSVSALKEPPKAIQPDNDFTILDGALKNKAELAAEIEHRRRLGSPVMNEPEQPPTPPDSATLDLPGVK
jgi:hypothetical protein